MDVSLGVVLSPADARIVLLDAAPPHSVIDQSQISLADGDVVSTLVSTDRQLTDTGHRLIATRVCGDDDARVAEVVNALRDADVMNVTAVSSPAAATAAAPVLTRGETTAILSVEGDTVALSIVDAATDTTSLIDVATIDADDRAAAYRELLERLAEEPGGATSVIMLDPAASELNAELTAASPVPVRYAEQSDFALAQGVALAGATDSFEAPLEAADPQDWQLAYSQVDGDDGPWLAPADAVPQQTPLDPLSGIGPLDPIDPDEVDDVAAGTAAPAPARPPILLVGSTIAGIVVVGFAALAVSVAIGIRPAVSQQALRVQDSSVPGDYMPVTPGQGVKPDDKNWTVVEQIPPAGTQTAARSFTPQALAQPASAAQPIIDMYPDGTVGVRDPNVPLPPVDSSIPAADGQAMDPLTQLVATRLIPDFSKFTPTDVLNFVSNMTAPVVAGVATGATIALANIFSAGGQSLADVGVLATVPATQGALYSTPAAATAGSAAASDPATLVGSIPSGLFAPGATDAEKAAVLPTGVTAISALPVADLPSGLSPLAPTITDRQSLGSTIVGTGPLPSVEPPVTELEKTSGGAAVSSAEVPTPSASSSAEADKPSPVSSVEMPKSSASVDAPESSPSPSPSPSVEVAKPSPSPSPSAEVAKPSPSASVEAPKSSASVEAPKSSATAEAPKGSPSAEAPKPSASVEAPKSPPARVQADEAPPPTLVVPAPKVVEPVQSAPVVPAPAVPAPKPVIPSLPAVQAPGSSSGSGSSGGGGLFGGGSSGGSSSGSSGGSSGGGLFGGGSSGGGLFGGGNG